MSAMTAELVELLSQESGRNRVRTAKLARVADDGTVFVAIDKDREVAVRVLTTLHVDELVSGVEMLLLQDEDPSAMPIVIGVVADKVSRMLPAESGRWETTIGNRNVKVVAGEDLRLECGRSSIVLTRDGRIVLRGVQITSRASNSNRIKGGNVEIN